MIRAPYDTTRLRPKPAGGVFSKYAFVDMLLLRRQDYFAQSSIMQRIAYGPLYVA